jgi:predicted CXXCH cytochrome family protein
MKSLSFLNRLWLQCRRQRGLALAAVAGGLLLAVISCSSVSNQAVVLPDVPGAKYIGSSECEQCHDVICRDFKTADHARLMTAGPNAKDVGCESCHGPCSLHSDSGGDVKPPYSFTPGRPIPAGLAGTTPGMSPAEAKETVCYQCHADVRGQFELPSHHPVPEGRMDCTLCHSPHKGSISAGGGTALMSQDDNCLQCHPAQRGPYVFEHEALREGCTTCHTAHGSVNAKLLTVRDSNLCLKCHFQQVQNGAILIGGSDHTVRLQEGTCWTAGCHEAVHGSRVSPSLRF